MSLLPERKPPRLELPPFDDELIWNDWANRLALVFIVLGLGILGIAFYLVNS